VHRWVHDLDAFHALSLDEQQRVIGRTKPDSIELGSTEAPAADEAPEAAAGDADSSQEPRSPDAPQAPHAQGPPPTSHVGRVVVESPDGTELEIYRRSIAYGNLTEAGLMFVAFSADPTRVETMLNRMFGNTDDGLRDSLTRFSTPVSTAVYFVPSLEELGDILG
jgi:putative iron-dependent peroxidase